MNWSAHLEQLSRKGLELWAQGDRLRFRAPEALLGQADIDLLKTHKPALLEHLRENPEALNRFPLSRGQRALWFTYRLDPSSPAYNLTATMRLVPGLDLEMMQTALDLIVQRHEVLRMVFRDGDDEPVQIRRNTVSIPIEHQNITDRSVWIETEGERPFDLTAEAPLRLVVGDEGDEGDEGEDGETRLALFCLHHIAGDLRAFERIILEWATVCEALHAGREPKLAKPGKPFVRWLDEERALLDGEAGRRARDYWRNQLAGELPVSDLPLDRPRPAIQTYAGRTHKFEVPGHVLQPMTALAKQSGTTLYTAVTAAFSLLLSRYGDQQELLLGIPVSQRTEAGFENTVGYFINPLVLRCRLDGRPRFQDVLRRTRAMVLEALEHAAAPFGDLVSDLEIRRDPSRSPLFQVAFVWEQHQTGGLDRSDLPFPFAELLHAGQRGSEFDLTLTATHSSQGLTCAWRYNTDLFAQTTIERMARAFADLLKTLPQDGDWLSAEQDYWRSHWRGSTPDYGDEDRLARLLENLDGQERNPIALSAPDRRLSGPELKRRAGLLAAKIQSYALPEETSIAILCERSDDLIIALLASLWSGHPYIPMDPHFPATRLAAMVANGKPGLMLTQSHLPFADDTLPRCDLDRFDWNGAPSAPPRRCADDRLAYSIYTSGSTGTPKGVQISRGALVNFLASMQARLALKPEHVFLSVTTISFDIAALEIFLPLLTGAQLVLADRETTVDPTSLGRRLQDVQATHMQATPATWRMLVDAGWRGMDTLSILSGGEALPEVLAAELQSRGREVWNLYGPTETTIWSAARRLETRADVAEVVAISGPLNHTQIHVMNQAFERQPIGAAGELVITGSGLARGYRNLPAKTATQFVPDPYGTQGARAYRTGDLVRALPDGTLSFLGRIDHQVKVRGFRIELGEIEVALRSHPTIREAVVLAVQDEDTTLVAYIEQGDEGRCSLNTLRDFLAEKLPAYMVPAEFMLMDSFPLTPNGKIDRRALPKPQGRSETDVFTAPRTQLETTLLDIWREILGKDGLGVDHDFFLAGGHSLNATRIATRISGALGVTLPVMSIFQGRTVAGLARLIEDQQPTEQTELVRNRERLLSPSQERLWFLEQLEGHGGAYLMSGVFALEGPLDVTALGRAFATVEARHDLLRTGIRNRDGRPEPFLHPQRQTPLVIDDLRDLLPSERRRIALDMAAKDGAEGFDFESTPLWRARLLRLGDDTHQLLITLHHMIADGLSIPRFLTEVSTCYRGGELPELTAQYNDFAHEQRILRTKALEGRTRTFWNQYLQGVPSCLELPTDRTRPAQPSFAGAELEFQLTKPLVRALRSLCAGHNATLTAGLHTLFAALLGRWAGVQDLVVGIPIANRNRPEWEPLIGLFVETLALRTRWTGDPSFNDLLHQVQSDLHAAQQHGDMPFDVLVDELEIERNLSYSPIFQVMMTLRDGSEEHLDLPGLKTQRLSKPLVNAKYDLSLYFSLEGDQLTGTLEYSRDLFDETRMQRLIDHFRLLTEAVTTHPQRPLSVCVLQSEDEGRFWLKDWNDTAQNHPSPLLTDVLRHHASHNPDRIALAGDTPLTYAAIDRAVDQLAARLQEQGVTAETPVGVFLERGPDLLVSLLAVLRSGGAYVPIDPSFPKERLAYLLEAASLNLLLTSVSLVPALPPQHSPLLDVTGCAQAQEEGPRPTPVRIQPDQLAYTIYTSGSTGNPKGVQINHGALMNFLHSMAQDPGLDQHDHLLAVTTVSFDIAALELYLPLLRGARLTIADKGTVSDPARLAETLADPSITVMQATPATWRMLRLSGWRRPIRVWCGGEALATDLAQGLLEDGHHLWNLYGPTETTIWSGCCRVRPQALARGSVPVGGPIANTRFVVLDRHAQPVPIGTPGQLFIGGDGLARGYHHLPARTAGQFVPDPFSDAPGARMYATGDLVRQEILGDERALVFLGRIDLQIKLRGFRIELGDIETHLNRHPDIRQAVALIRQSADGDTQLMAFLKTEASQDWASWLAEKLPGYMIPSRFITCQSLPMTPNAKVDRGALARQAVTLRDEQTAVEPPATDMERALAAIWRSLLEIETVGRDHSFFALGGHSLLATRMLARVKGELGRQAPLSALFTAPSLRDFAAILEEGEAGEEKQSLIVDRSRPLPLSSAQKRLWFLHQLDPTSGAYNMPGTLRIRGALKEGVVERALGLITARHEMLRAVFHVGGEVVILPRHQPIMTCEDVADEAELQNIRRHEATQALDTEGPLIRCRLIRRHETDHVLLLTLHHLLADDWSLQVLIQDLTTAIEALQIGDEPVFVAKPLDYLDWVAAQEARDFSAARNYWLEALAEVPQSIDLPTDLPYPKAQTFAGDEVVLDLDKALVDRLEALCQTEGATLFMGLLAAFETLLTRHTGQERFLIGAQVANRNRTDDEPIVGLFTNTILLAADMGGDPSVRTLLQRVRETCLNGFAHAEMPFEQVIDALQPARQLARNPLFQVAINLLNTPKPPAAREGLSFETPPQPRLFSKVELSLEIQPSQTGLRCFFEYNTALFTKATIQQWADRFAKLIEAMVTAPAQALGAVVTPDEHSRLITAWNPEPRPLEGASFIRRFEAQVALHGDRQAVHADGVWTSYRELDQRANHLAGILIAEGAGHETLVGICCNRGLDMMVALLAVQKAGAAYVPIDPDYPEDRIAHMLTDGNLSLVLTERARADRLGSHACKRLCLEDVARQTAAQPPQRDLTGDQLAYMIYTSGSTNKPKGVMLSHDTLINFLTSMSREPGFTHADTMLAVTTLSFDIAGLELYLPLLVGGRLVIADRGTTLDGHLMAEVIQKLGVTTMQATPSSWRLLEAAGFAGSLKRLCGGEALPADLAEQLLARPGELWNMYGPTETTIWSATRRVRNDWCGQTKKLTAVSGPIDNTTLFVLDRYLNPVPPGTPGQLYIGGLGLARGYRGRADLTAQVFVPDPFSNKPGARLYATGDSVRLVPPASDETWPDLQFLGRLDHQVKIRGFRVELGEIETALSKHAQVQEAVATVRGTPAKLVAHFVPRDPNNQSDTASLRMFLAEHLPAYMMPEHILAIETFPRTPNGKIDRKALPEPNQTRTTVQALNNDLERQIAAVWRDVLDIPAIGATDNFFDLGGTSFLLMAVRTGLKDAGHDLSVMDLLEHTTVTALASWLGARAQSAQAPDHRLKNLQDRQAKRDQRRRPNRRKPS